MKIDSKFTNKVQKKDLIIFFLFSTITLISSRWLISYLFFPSEPLLNKVIFDLEDHLYFPLIVNLSNLDFSPDYLVNYFPNKIITFPIYSLIFHAAIYSIFGEYSFIIAEFKYTQKNDVAKKFLAEHGFNKISTKEIANIDKNFDIIFSNSGKSDFNITNVQKIKIPFLEIYNE